MKILFIGGTGIISSACAEPAVARGHELFVLNRSVSKKYPLPDGATLLKGDIHTDEAHLASLVAGHRFDAVVDYIAFTPHDIERDLRLFRDRTDQFVFISSASAYQKPVKIYLITEETPLENPYWEYSRNKIACEQLLMREHHDSGFPITIIRPSLTYGPSQIAGELAEEIRRAVTLYGAVPSDDNDGLKAIFLSGGGAKLAGLRSLLEGTMAVPVGLTEPFRGFSVNKNIDREYLIEAAPYFAVGAGLSIRRPGDR